MHHAWINSPCRCYHQVHWILLNTIWQSKKSCRRWFIISINLNLWSPLIMVHYSLLDCRTNKQYTSNGTAACECWAGVGAGIWTFYVLMFLSLNKNHFSHFHHKKFLGLQCLYLQQEGEAVQERLRGDLHGLQEAGGCECAACLHLRLRGSSVHILILVIIR